jgi:hypothetical protein
VKAEEKSVVLVGLVLRFSPQVSIGFNMMGTRVVLELMPGVMIIPVTVKIG